VTLCARVRRAGANHYDLLPDEPVSAQVGKAVGPSAQQTPADQKDAMPRPTLKRPAAAPPKGKSAKSPGPSPKGKSAKARAAIPKAKSVKSSQDGTAVKSSTGSAKRESKAKTPEEKAGTLLQRRLTTPAPLGRCPHMDCQAALKVIPPHGSGEPWIACPRYSSKLCKGYIRSVRHGEEALMPKKLFKRVRLE
jgi:hypothetical protein